MTLRTTKKCSLSQIIGEKSWTDSEEAIDFHVLATLYIQGFTDYGGSERGLRFKASSII